MKRLISWFFIVTTYFPFVKSNSYSSLSNGEYSVITSDWIELKQDEVWIRFENIDNQEFLDFKLFTVTPLTISSDNTLVFQSNSQVAQFKPSSNFSQTLINDKDFDKGPIYEITGHYSGNFSFFQNNIVSSVTINTISEPHTFYLPSKIGIILQKNYKSFFQNSEKNLLSYNEQQELILRFPCTITFFRKKKSETNWDEIRSIKRILTEEELIKVIKEWEDRSNNKYEYRASYIVHTIDIYQK